jgi:hypothetical protein
VNVEDGSLFRLCKPDEDEILIWTAEFAAKKNSEKRFKYLLSAQLRDLEQVFRDYVQHPELKSMAPHGSPCTAATHGLLQRRPVRALTPFGLIGKEVEGSIQDDFAVLSDAQVLEYGSLQDSEPISPSSGQTSFDRLLQRKLKTMSRKELARQTGLDRNAIRRVLRGERFTRKRERDC